MQYLKCNKCGEKVFYASKQCPYCNAPLGDAIRVVDFKWENVSNRSRLKCYLLAWSLGLWGIHDFYLGHYRMAVARLIVGLVLTGLFVYPFVVTTSWPSGMYLIVRVGFSAMGFISGLEGIEALTGQAHDAGGYVVRKWW